MLVWRVDELYICSPLSVCSPLAPFSWLLIDEDIDDQLFIRGTRSTIHPV